MLFLHDIYHIIRMEQDNLYNLLQSIDTFAMYRALPCSDYYGSSVAMPDIQGQTP